MATKERHKSIPPGDHTLAGVKKYAAAYEISEKDAWDYLAQYALNRIATLARYEAGKPKKEKKPKAAKPKAAKPKKEKKTRGKSQGLKRSAEGAAAAEAARTAA